MKKIFYCVIALMTLVTAASSAAEISGNMAEVSTAKPKPVNKTVIFEVHLHCENCVKKVRENISFEKGVKALEVSLEDQTVKITYDPRKTDEKTLAEAIGKLGYEVKGKRNE
ncbi:MAG: heavy-metal-associated domain-containing protein [Clostridium sp.]|nr:heavy-metal-associated domain-containing protein [Bacteroides sp.]MCM1198845.1 heavy-metal-associated domain-containing protein [Clostridium sp.]